jgi:hypothetical protein
MSMVMSTRARHALLGLLVATLCLAVLACAGCSGTSASSSSTSSTAAGMSADAKTIAGNWMRFFRNDVPADDKAALLENGAQHLDALATFAASAFGKALVAAVSSVKVTSATTAEVVYSILLNNNPVFPGLTGKAVLQDSVWKVSEETFQALLDLQKESSSTSLPASPPVSTSSTTP